MDIFNKLPKPKKINLDKPFDIVVTGIGGTGVVTIGALIGMASHMENKGVSVLDCSSSSNQANHYKCRC